MRYGQLINFTSLVTVIELRSADDTAKAKELVSSYVMSDSMAELIEVILVNEIGCHPYAASFS